MVRTIVPMALSVSLFVVASVHGGDGRTDKAVPKAESAAKTEALRRIVDECNKASLAAFKKGDMLAVARHFSDDATIYFPQGKCIHGREAIDRMWLSIKGARDWKLETLEVGGTAEAIYELGKSTLTGVVDGKPSTYVSDYVAVWKRQKDGSYKTYIDIYN